LIILIAKLFYRYLGHLKSYVRNKAQPEGCIAKEVLTFRSEYIEGVKIRSNRPSRVDDSCNTNMPQLSTIFPPIGRVVSVSSTFEMSTMQRTQAHRYVLFNWPEVTLFIE